MKLPINTILEGKALKRLKEMPDESVDCVMTSPPYWGLRDYGVEGQLGMEADYQDYILKLCDIFDEVKRVLKKSGTCWINLGDTYSGNSSYSSRGRQGFEKKDGNRKEYLDPKLPARLRAREHVNMMNIPNKCLCMIPERFAIEMVNRGWILRNQIIWHKPSCMPSSVKDRFTVDFEKIFFFVKSKKYYFEQQMEKTKTKDNIIRDRNISRLNNTPGRTKMGGLTQNNYDFKNKRTTWSINTKPFSEAHFAVYPEALIQTPIRAGCPEGGIVLDPFFGAGTTGVMAKKLRRNWVGIELNPEYIEIAKNRVSKVVVSKSLFEFVPTTLDTFK